MGYRPKFKPKILPLGTGPIMFIRAYLQASSEEQDAGRARDSLEQFAADHDKAVASVYLKNASGATADRPELLRLRRAFED